MLTVGTMVVLIGREDDMPPIGACGTIVAIDPELLDGAQCYDVVFPHHPCPNPPTQAWICAHGELLPVEPYQQPREERADWLSDLVASAWLAARRQGVRFVPIERLRGAPNLGRRLPPYWRGRFVRVDEAGRWSWGDRP